MSLDDVAVRTHVPKLSTYCAKVKHELSFDRRLRRWQLPPMGIGERIAHARTARGLSQASLGKLVGAGQTTVSSWERGRTEPTRDDVQRVAGALNLDVAELEQGGSILPRRTVPLVGFVSAGAQAVLFGQGQGPFDEVDAPEGANESTVAVEIRGDSLGPLFNEWLVYYDDVRRPVTTDLIGRLCVVGLPDERILVKKLQRSRSEGLFHLLSQTEDPILDAEVDWAARVRQMTPR